jgi:hypothetical protein
MFFRIFMTNMALGLCLMSSIESIAMFKQATEGFRPQSASLASGAYARTYAIMHGGSRRPPVKEYVTPPAIQKQIMPYVGWKKPYRDELSEFERGIHFTDLNRFWLHAAIDLIPYKVKKRLHNPMNISMALLTGGMGATLIMAGDPITGGGFLAGSAVFTRWWRLNTHYTQDPLLGARSLLKQALRKYFYTDEERLEMAKQALINDRFSKIKDNDPSELPLDIINKPLFEGGYTLLQVLLQNEKIRASTIEFSIKYGAVDPQQHEPHTPHPIDELLNSLSKGYDTDEASLILLALVNPYITKYNQPIPGEIVKKLKEHVVKQREKLTEKANKTLNSKGEFVLDKPDKAKFANRFLALKQIEEALAMRGTYKAGSRTKLEEE